MCSIVDPRVRPDDRATRVLVPVRRAEADEGRHHVHALGVRHLVGKLLDIGRLGDDPQAVADPLHRGSGDEHRTLEGVDDLAVVAPGDRGEQPILRRDRLLARVDEHERAGAVGLLRHARLEAGLAERGRLLVPGVAGDLDRAAQERRLAVDLGRRPRRRHHRARDVHDPEQLVVPVERVDVEQQRAAGVRVVHDVCAALGQAPDEEAVDGSEEQLARLRLLLCPRVVLEDVPDLRAAEVGVHREAGLLAELLLVAGGLELVAVAGRDAALPDDRVLHRLAGRLLPDHRRLALVGDADRGDVIGRRAGICHHLLRDRQLGVPDRLGVVLDVAGRREDLWKFLVGGGMDRAVRVEQDGAARRGSLIQGQDVLGHSIASYLSVARGW